MIKTHEHRMAMEYVTDSSTLTLKNATHHAIFLMDENGVVTTWNTGAENIFGYTADEIIGFSSATLFVKEDIANGHHVAEMNQAVSEGYSEDDRWHLRKDGTKFWASGAMTPVFDDQGSFKGFLKIIRDKTPAKLANERALYLAMHDSLTGLPNRSMFNEHLSSTLADAKLSQSVVQVLLLDLDRFKDINDSYGHQVGDLFLKHVAKRLTQVVRSSDLVARLGGDEFGIICRTADGTADGEALAEKLVAKLSLPYHIEGKEVHSGVSIGITQYPFDSTDADQMVRNADLAMYAAKNSGRSTYRLHTEDLNYDAARRCTIAQWLKRALEEQSLLLHYQIQYQLKDGRISGAEALLRWSQDPVPDLSAEEVVAVADEAGLAAALGEWTLRSACRQASEWRSQGLTDFRIAVNVSSSQLNAPSFLKVVDNVLIETGLPAECLELEITELMLMENSQANDLLLRSLKKKGVWVSVDDFGTGFSSLRSLRTFPVDMLKIDQDFVRESPQNEHDAVIVSAIIGLAHSLDLKVAAEGIESQEQADFLTGLGCDYGQGIHLAAPALGETLFADPSPVESEDELSSH